MWQKCRKEFEDAPQHKKADEDRMKLGQLGLTTWSWLNDRYGDHSQYAPLTALVRIIS
jgi:hypothetical protein